MRNSQAKLKRINRKESFLKNHGLKSLEKGRVKLSSNVNEVIRAVLNFFYEKILHAQNAQNVHKRTKTKKSAFYAHKKRLFAYLCFLCFCLDAYLYFLCVQNLFVKKKMKRFQTDDLMTSFTLLLKFILLLTWYFFNYYNPFQLSQCFPIITILFNYPYLFQLSKYFSIITISLQSF